MNIKKLNEQMETILSEEVVRQGKTINGNPWTEDKIGEKEVNILGVTLKYNIVRFHVDMPEEDKTSSDKDRIEYNLVNTEVCDEIEKIIENTIHAELGNNINGGGSKQIGIPIHGYILD